jgi:hypothetical protein
MKLVTIATLTLAQVLTVLVDQCDGWNLVSTRPTQHQYLVGTVRRWDMPLSQMRPRVVHATSSSDPGGSVTEGTKKKRRRKVAPPVATESPSVSIDTSINGGINREDTLKDQTMAAGDDAVDDLSVTKEDLATLNEIAKFEFKQDTAKDSAILRDNLDAPGTTPSPLVDQSSVGSNSNELLLPDIKEARKRKQMEEEMARQQAQSEKKVKIKRSDKEAMRKVSRRIREAAVAAAHWCLRHMRMLVSLYRESSFVSVVAISHCAGPRFCLAQRVCACVAIRAATLCRCRRFVL